MYVYIYIELYKYLDKVVSLRESFAVGTEHDLLNFGLP